MAVADTRPSTAATLEGTIRGVERASALEQARSKLLFGHIPRGRSTRVELTERIALWKSGHFHKTEYTK